MSGITTRAAAILFAASWFVFPGFGLIDLSVTWSADWPQALEAGWGLFSTVIVGAAFSLVALQPHRALAAASQLAVATASLAISAAAGREAGLAWLVIVLALQTAVLVGLSGRVRRGGLRRWPGRPPVPRPLLVVAVLGAGPWFVYALDMWALNRRGQPIDVTLGVDHFAMQGALALAFAVLPIVVALRPELRAFLPACAGLAASYLGLVSLAWPDASGGVTLVWSVLAMCWGVALLAVTFAGRARFVPPRST